MMTETVNTNTCEDNLTPAQPETKVIVANGRPDLQQIRKGAIIRILQLSPKHIEAHPADEYLNGKRVKLLNTVFMVEEVGTGKITVITYGAKIQVQTSDLLTNPK